MIFLLFLAFLAVPIIEIAVIIKVGGAIGVWPTIGLIVLTAGAGTALVRAQGFQILARARDSLDHGQFPAEELLEALSLLVAGVLLLTPGFVTDAFGIVLLIPPLRRLIAGALWRAALRSSHVEVHGVMGAQWRGPRDRDGVIEGDYTDITGAPSDRNNDRDLPRR